MKSNRLITAVFLIFFLNGNAFTEENLILSMKCVGDNSFYPLHLKFDPAKKEYAMMTDYSVFSVYFITETSKTAQLTINSIVSDKNTNGPYYLKFGKNSFNVTAGQITGKKKQTYSIFIHRLPTGPVPTIFIDADKEIPDDPKILACMNTYTNYMWGSGEPGNSLLCGGYKIGIEIRGNSSQINDQNLKIPKGQYSVKLLDKKNNDVDARILGMPLDSEWVLYGPYTDKTLIRNFLAYELAREIGMYAPRTIFAELYLDQTKDSITTNDYFGLFLMIERIKPSPYKVNIHTMNPYTDTLPGLEGGYIFKKDKPDEDMLVFSAYSKTEWMLVYPKPKKATPVQVKWITKYVYKFEEALFQKNFDPVNGYAKYLDVSKFIDLMILNMLSKNADSYIFSTYYYKDKFGKIVAGPPWDYDLAWGNINYYNCYDPKGWWVPYRLFPSKLLDDPSFVKAVIARWFELRKTVLNWKNIALIIDNISIYLDEAQKRNFQKWQILGTYVWPNPKPLPITYDEEIMKIKEWILTRLIWIDENIKNIGNLPPENLKK